MLGLCLRPATWKPKRDLRLWGFDPHPLCFLLNSNLSQIELIDGTNRTTSSSRSRRGFLRPPECVGKMESDSLPASVTKLQLQKTPKQRLRTGKLLHLLDNCSIVGPIHNLVMVQNRSSGRQSALITCCSLWIRSWSNGWNLLNKQTTVTILIAFYVCTKDRILKDVWRATRFI